jgi:hypothetical protein
MNIPLKSHNLLTTFSTVLIVGGEDPNQLENMVIQLEDLTGSLKLADYFSQKFRN